MSNLNVLFLTILNLLTATFSPGPEEWVGESLDESALAEAMTRLVTEELQQRPGKRYLEEIEVQAHNNVVAGSMGLVVSREFDPLILTAIQWGESRFRATAESDTAVGPMQVHKAAYRYNWEEISPEGILVPTKDDLRDPWKNTLAGYLILEYRQRLCSSGPELYKLFWSYRRSGCSPKRAPDGHHSKERCRVLSRLAEELGVEWPEGVTCSRL